MDRLIAARAARRRPRTTSPASSPTSSTSPRPPPDAARRSSARAAGRHQPAATAPRPPSMRPCSGAAATSARRRAGRARGTSPGQPVDPRLLIVGVALGVSAAAAAATAGRSASTTSAPTTSTSRSTGAYQDLVGGPLSGRTRTPGIDGQLPAAVPGAGRATRSSPTALEDARQDRRAAASGRRVRDAQSGRPRAGRQDAPTPKQPPPAGQPGEAGGIATGKPTGVPTRDPADRRRPSLGEPSPDAVAAERTSRSPTPRRPTLPDRARGPAANGGPRYGHRRARRPSSPRPPPIAPTIADATPSRRQHRAGAARASPWSSRCSPTPTWVRATRRRMPAGICRLRPRARPARLVAHLARAQVRPVRRPAAAAAGALLNGLGLVLIWRLDLPTADPARRAAVGAFPRADAPRQLLWTAVGHRAVRGRADLPQGPPGPAALHLHLDGRRPGPAAPAAGAGPRPDGQRRQDLDPGRRPFSIQPGEFAKIVLIGLLRRLPGGQARRARAGQPPRSWASYLPRGRDLGPILVVWALSLADPGLRDATSAPRCCSSACSSIMLYVATERTSWIVFGLLLSAAARSASPAFEPHVQQRVDVWLDPFGRSRTAHGHQLGAGAVRPSAPAASLGTGLGQGNSDLIGFAANSDFILATVGEELGLAGVMAILLLYGLIVRARRAHRPRRPRPLRQAARRSASPAPSPSRSSSSPAASWASSR